MLNFVVVQPVIQADCLLSCSFLESFVMLLMIILLFTKQLVKI